MDITIHPRALRGELNIIPSKSQAHRLLICAAFADTPTRLLCSDTNRDIEATADCLRALGADITRTDSGFTVHPVTNLPVRADLPCCESGSTLRFMLPIAGALGVDATFLMEGRLPHRPLSSMWEEMERMGCTLTRPTPKTIRCTGKLHPGEYVIVGSISSQYITGLLLALSLLEEECQIHITGRIESKPYIQMTRDAITCFGGNPDRPGGRKLHSPGTVTVEGDWSNAAFFLAADALASKFQKEACLRVHGLNYASAQGDREVTNLLPLLMQGCPTISCADIPDLVPILSVVAACCYGAVFTDISRLRLKESDRVYSVIDMLTALGGKASAAENVLIVQGTGLQGGIVDAVNDHRIAMSAAIAATVCDEEVTILGAECVQKSYPRFWEEYNRLGGQYEQHLR